MSEEKKLLCGAGEADITPPIEIVKGMRGLTGTRYGGIHDPLKAHAIAFSNGEDRAVLIQIDMDKDQAPTRLLPEISQRWNVPEENILYFGMHTHSAPLFTGRHEFETRNPSEYERTCTEQYEPMVFDGIYQAVEQAFQTLRPAKIGCGRQACYTNAGRVKKYFQFDENGEPCGVINTQGNDPGASISHEMFVMRVNDMDEKPIAFLVNYPMHCITMLRNQLAEDGTDLISGDVGGNISRLLEKRFPGAIAVWSSGAAGDITPLLSHFGTYMDPETNELVDYNLDGYAEKILNHVLSEQFATVLQAINSIPYYSGDGRIIGKIDWSNTPGYKIAPHPETGWPTPTEEVDEEGSSIRVQLLRIGDVLLTGIGGELFNSYGEELKALSPLKNTVIITHNCSLITNIGYILDDKTIEENCIFMPGRPTQIIPGYIRESLDQILFRFFN